MKQRPPWQQILGLTGVLFLLVVGCTPFTEVTLSPDAEATAPVRASATPTSCVGWTCTLRGIVYVNTARPGNELPGALVKLSHASYCSPTAGEHKTGTELDGTFHFNVYLHDTDTFWFEVEEEGYEPVRLSLGGFDCLSCKCPPVEIVLKPQ
jgi:hypothetical protein